MRYLSIYTPARPMSGPPSPEEIAKMGALVEEMTKTGKLVMTGPLAKRETGGLIVTRSGDKFETGKANHVAWMRAGGFAILEAETREELIDQAKRFLSVGGEGTCEILAMGGGVPPK